MREKGSVKKALLKVLAKAAEDEMEINVYSWPPICASILHQPERPKRDLSNDHPCCKESNSVVSNSKRG